MAQRRALTAAQVAALSDEGVHWVAPSLYLQIRPQDTRSWLFRCSRNGENQWKGIGAAADKPLREARDEAATLRVAMRRGEDPFAERAAAKAATKPKAKVPSFADCAGRYIESHRAGWRNDKHVAQWESTIRSYANPVLGKLPVDRVTVDQVLVFPGSRRNKPLSNMSMLKCLRTIRSDTDETVHGFRSSFRDWAAEQTDYPREIVEACLAHATGGAVELAYRRTDFLEKRRGPKPMPPPRPIYYSVDPGLDYIREAPDGPSDAQHGLSFRRHALGDVPVVHGGGHNPRHGGRGGADGH